MDEPADICAMGCYMYPLIYIYVTLACLVDPTGIQLLFP
jgi:hypothetical protein